MSRKRRSRNRVQRTHEVRLAAETIAALREIVAEALGSAGQAADQPQLPPPRLTAAEVAEWWGVERSWVYAHADELGVRRLGTGPRPRLRFEPEEVAERLGAPLPGSRDTRGSQRLDAGPHTDSLSARSGVIVAEYGRQTAGRRTNAPGPAPKEMLRRDTKPSPPRRSRRHLPVAGIEEMIDDGS